MPKACLPTTPLTTFSWGTFSFVARAREEDPEQEVTQDITWEASSASSPSTLRRRERAREKILNEEEMTRKTFVPPLI